MNTLDTYLIATNALNFLICLLGKILSLADYFD